MKKITSLFLLIVIITISIYSIFNISFKDNRDISKYISVEIRGEVKKEKVLLLELGATFNDVLEQIELTENSDISDISLNCPLYNNQVISIRKKTNKALISINSASIDELCTLPGIGIKTAEKIIKYREINGSFNSLEEIMNVSGIGIKKYEKIKDYISI